MLNKMKKIIMPFMLGAMLFGGVGQVSSIVEPVNVYAADPSAGDTDYSKVPDIKLDANGELTVDTLKSTDGENVYTKSLSEFRKAVIFISGIGTVCMILFFILNFINLGKSQGNPQERQKAISGLIISGIASAGLGSVTMIVALFFNAL